MRWRGSALIGVIGDKVRRYPLDWADRRDVPRSRRSCRREPEPGRIAVASLAEEGVTIREVASGKRRAAMKQTAEGDDLYENGLDLVWARDGSRVAFLGQEKHGQTLRVLDTRSGKLLRRLAAKDVYGLGSARSRRLATGSSTRRAITGAWSSSTSPMVPDGAYATPHQRWRGHRSATAWPSAPTTASAFPRTRRTSLSRSRRATRHRTCAGHRTVPRSR